MHEYKYAIQRLRSIKLRPYKKMGRSGLNPWPQLNVDLPAIASCVQVPRPIMHELDLYNLWPQLNVDLSTIVSGVQAPGQLYTSWTCYKTTGTIPAVIERGLYLAWTARWIKK